MPGEVLVQTDAEKVAAALRVYADAQAQVKGSAPHGRKLSSAVMAKAADDMARILSTTVDAPVLGIPSPADIIAGMTPAGGFDYKTLASWGVELPPRKGWRAQLEARWHAEQRESNHRGE